MLAEDAVLNGRYRLDRLIGVGGFARVFLATDLLLKRLVAVKVLNPDLGGEADFLARFAREAQAVAALEHPHILGVHDYGEAGGTAYLVMPYVEGGSLHDRLRAAGRLAPGEAAEYLRQAAAALDYAHARGVVHRDVKPQNLLLRDGGARLLLSDFGIAKVLGAASAHSRTGVVGTLAYMAPEQFEGHVGPATDVYALGCVLFQLLTGRLPYDGTTEQVLYGHLAAPVPALAAHSRAPLALPPGVQGVVARALAKRPEARFATAGELAGAFAAALAGAPAAPAPEAPPAPAPPGRERAATLPAGPWAEAPTIAAAGPRATAGGADPDATVAAPPAPPPGQDAPTRGAGPPPATAPSSAPMWPRFLLVAVLAALAAALLLGGGIYALTRPDTGATATANARATERGRQVAAASTDTAGAVAMATGTAEAIATATAGAPTATPVPPTATTMPPTATTVPPTPTPVPPTPTPVLTTAYRANFATWWSGSDAGQDQVAVDPATGEYRVKVLAANSGLWLPAPDAPAFGDFVLQVDARRVAGPDAGAYGL
ncbi:MAG TPA: serine/threonine-protein kinase, partial [Thermomicrobiales bacterium]|nr:serine/threonine-protein kinase [Thermomicrobiales bacterium]